jgi:hypothetical protein
MDPEPGDIAAEDVSFKHKNKTSAVTQLKNVVASNPLATLAIIILLIIAVVYMVAREKGWFGLGTAQKKGKLAAGGGAKQAKPSGNSDDDNDPEADKLINSINSS